MTRKIIFLFAGLIIFIAFWGDPSATPDQAKGSPVGDLKQTTSQLPVLAVEPDKAVSLAIDVAVSTTDKTSLLTVDPQKAQSLLSAPFEYRIVTGNRVNLRAGPSTKFKVVGQLSKGAKTKYVEQKGKWLHIKLTDGSNLSGWMSATYLSANAPKYTPTKALAKAPQKKPPKRGIAAPTSREISNARQIIINQSIASYTGSCPCPYNRDRGGRRCGKRSAWSRPGGYSPMCYDSDITQARLATHFARVRGVSN